MIYFKIDPSNDSIQEVISKPYALEDYNTKETSLLNGKPFLVPVTVTDPSFDHATQVKTGPVDAYDGANAKRIYTIRDKTKEELQSEALAADEHDLSIAAKDLPFVLIELIDHLSDENIVNTNDFSTKAKQAYLDVKTISDRINKA
ncbi:MAG: hypothetical protein JAY90_18585 [Candidatus Thiodiazotropha lotti]|nr:hypothetical protein [Candidatus Thiodiazotropha lotti]